MTEKRKGLQSLAEVEAALGERLNPHTNELLNDFTQALRNKLLHAQVRYGRHDGWRNDDWEEECRRDLMTHLAKGDPRDVAAYCMFMWHHGWSTRGQPAQIVRADLGEGES